MDVSKECVLLHGALVKKSPPAPLGGPVPGRHCGSVAVTKSR